MIGNPIALATIFDGWNGYQTSLIHAIAPLTREQLLWQPAASSRSIGETARHIRLGRVSWFSRMGAPGSEELVHRIGHWETDRDGNRDVVENSIPITDQADELFCLAAVDDLAHPVPRHSSWRRSITAAGFTGD